MHTALQSKQVQVQTIGFQAKLRSHCVFQRQTVWL